MGSVVLAITAACQCPPPKVQNFRIVLLIGFHPTILADKSNARLTIPKNGPSAWALGIHELGSRLRARQGKRCPLHAMCVRATFAPRCSRFTISQISEMIGAPSSHDIHDVTWARFLEAIPADKATWFAIISTSAALGWTPRRTPLADDRSPQTSELTSSGNLSTQGVKRHGSPHLRSNNMKQHISEESFTRSIDWSPFVIMDSAMPPRDPDEDEEDEEEEEEHADESPVVREPDED